MTSSLVTVVRSMEGMLLSAIACELQERPLAPEVFELHLRERVRCYYPELHGQRVDVVLESTSARPQSTFYRYQVRSAEWIRLLRVKVPVLRPVTASPERPRVVPLPDPQQKFAWETAALIGIARHFETLADPRFGAVRVLECLPEYGATVMEEVQGTSLRSRLAHASRLNPKRSPSLERAFRYTGAWLRAFHLLPPPDHTIVRDERRADFKRTIHDLTRYLGCRLGRERYFERVATMVCDRAARVLPETLPLGLRHGDFAPRNVLLGPEDRVTVIDTMARWLSPSYEDLGYFLIALRTARPQVLTQGLAYSPGALQQFERAFLAGYYNGDVTLRDAIRMYEIQALLDRWASAICQRKSKRPAERLEAILLDRYFRTTTERLLAHIVKA